MVVSKALSAPDSLAITSIRPAAVTEELPLISAVVRFCTCVMTKAPPSCVPS